MFSSISTFLILSSIFISTQAFPIPFSKTIARRDIPDLSQHKHYSLKPSGSSLALHAGPGVLDLFRVDVIKSLVVVEWEINNYDPTPSCEKIDLGGHALGTYIFETKKDITELSGIHFENIKLPSVKNSIDIAIRSRDPRHVEATAAELAGLDEGYKAMVKELMTGNEYGRLITNMLATYKGLENQEVTAIYVSRRSGVYQLTFHWGLRAEKQTFFGFHDLL